MNLQWNSALDQGSLQLGSYGSTNPSLTLISSEVTRETGDCIDFNGYAKITQTIDGVTVSYIVHITGYVNTETNTANWSCGAMPGSY
jgi:hypothetical protein